MHTADTFSATVPITQNVLPRKEGYGHRTHGKRTLRIQTLSGLQQHERRNIQQEANDGCLPVDTFSPVEQAQYEERDDEHVGQ